MSDSTCMFKMPDTERLCGAPATMRTSLNEDPYGQGTWCKEHAPPAAVPAAPADPNRDNRVPLPT